MAFSNTFPYAQHSYYLWLTGPSRQLKPTSAQDYTKWVLHPHPGWPLLCARKAGLCPADQTLEELSIAQLYQVIRICEGKFRTALWSYMDYRLEQDQPASFPVQPGCGPALVEVLRALGATVFNLRLKDACDQLVGALLLDPDLELADKKETRDRCLTPTGKDYPRYRAIALENLELHREDVLSALSVSLPGTITEQRLQAARFSKKMLEQYRNAPGFASSRTCLLLQRLEGLAPADPDWYAEMAGTEERLTRYLLNNLMDLLEQSLSSREGSFGQPAPLQTDVPHDLLLCALLAPFRNSLSPELCRSCPPHSSHHITRLLELGLMRVEQRDDRPVLVPSQEVFLLSDYSGLLQQIWEDPTLLPVLNALLDNLCSRQQECSAPERAPALTQELASLLAAAPSEDPLSCANEAQRAADRLTRILVNCHWSVCQGPLSPERMNSLRRLVRLYQARPRATAEALRPLLAREMNADWKTALSRDPGTGACPVLGDLYYRLCDDALALSTDPTLSPEQQLGCISCALSASERAAAIGGQRRKRPTTPGLGGWHLDPLLALDASILRMRACCALARLLATSDDAADSDLIADALIPWARSVEACDQWAGVLRECGLPCAQERLTGPLRLTACSLFSPDRAVGSRLSPAHRLPDPEQATPGRVAQWLNNQLQTRQDHPLSLRAAQAPAPQMSSPDPLRLHNYWYCDFLDSGLAAQRRYSQKELEAYLLKLLLSGQNLVLSLNQITDNDLLRALAWEPHFLAAVRSGQVAVSFYADFSDLISYAAVQMENVNFHWSSLDFIPDQNAALRHQAALYLRGHLSEYMLPTSCRQGLIRFRAELSLLDEAIRECHRVRFFQRPAAGQSLPTLFGQMNEYYAGHISDPRFEEMCRIHNMISRALSHTCFNRSSYQSLLARIKVGDYSALAVSREWESYLDQLWTPENLKLLNRMQVVLDHCQNRVVGLLCSPFQHQLISADDRFLIPPDQFSPLSRQGIRLYRDIQITTETGTAADWSQLAQRRSRLDRLAAETCSAETLSQALSDEALHFEPDMRSGRLLLRRALLRSTDHYTQLVEQGTRGNIHLEREAS